MLLSRFIIMLASQPAMPPTINATIQPMVCLLLVATGHRLVALRVQRANHWFVPRAHGKGPG
jgi:hypothetical protein